MTYPVKRAASAALILLSVAAISSCTVPPKPKAAAPAPAATNKPLSTASGLTPAPAPAIEKETDISPAPAPRRAIARRPSAATRMSSAPVSSRTYPGNAAELPPLEPGRSIADDQGYGSYGEERRVYENDRLTFEEDRSIFERDREDYEQAQRGGAAQSALPGRDYRNDAPEYSYGQRGPSIQPRPYDDRFVEPPVYSDEQQRGYSYDQRSYGTQGYSYNYRYGDSRSYSYRPQPGPRDDVWVDGYGKEYRSASPYSSYYRGAPVPSYDSADDRARASVWHGYNARDGLPNGY